MHAMKCKSNVVYMGRTYGYKFSKGSYFLLPTAPNRDRHDFSMPSGHLSLSHHGGRGLDYLICMLVPCETVTGLAQPWFNRNWKVKPSCTLKSQDAHLHLIWRLPINLAFQANRVLFIHTCLYFRVILLRGTWQVDNLPLGRGSSCFISFFHQHWSMSKKS